MEDDDDETGECRVLILLTYLAAVAVAEGTTLRESSSLPNTMMHIAIANINPARPPPPDKHLHSRYI